MKPILSNATSNLTGRAILVAQCRPGRTVGISGEHVTIIAAGTFEGMTVTVEVAPTKDGPWLALEDGAFTAPAVKVSPLSDRAYIRAVTSGSYVTSDVSVWVG